MSEFQAERDRMVREQIEGRGIEDQRVCQALRKVPRHLFVGPESRDLAHGDYPLPIGHGQTISQPYMVAFMTEALGLEPSFRVLEVGTGSGYQTAVLAELVAQVYTVERIALLQERSARTLGALGYSNIRFKVGDGSRGWPDHGPYDAIVVTAGAPHIPPPLLDQLALPHGRLVAPVGSRRHQVCLSVRWERGQWRPIELAGCVFVELVGEHGWPGKKDNE